MAPAQFYQKFGRYILRNKVEQNENIPYITAAVAVGLSIIFTIAYVLPFYLSPLTRPSPTLSRDAPSVIRARVRFVTLSVAGAMLATAYVLRSRALESAPTILHRFGVFPPNILGTAKALLLNSVLFAGPLFERCVVDGRWRSWITGQELNETLSGWIGWRNYVAGPLTEELLFRSAIVTLHLVVRPLLSLDLVVFATPLYFGIAHIHHFYEFKLTHPYTPILPTLVRSLIQFAYTTVFGWYATFIYLRTGSLWAAVAVHSMCNWLGLPRLWGRVGDYSSSSAPGGAAALSPLTIDDIDVNGGLANNSSSSSSNSSNNNISHKTTDGAPLSQNNHTSSKPEQHTWKPKGANKHKARPNGISTTSFSSGGSSASLAWTVAYYTLLLLGAIGFCVLLFPLTDSPANALAIFPIHQHPATPNAAVGGVGAPVGKGAPPRGVAAAMAAAKMMQKGNGKGT